MVRNTTDMNREEYNQKMDVSHLKRNLTLNLHSDNSDNKRKISPLMGGIPSILSSPDIKKFNLTTPDIEKMFSHSSVLQTPTPNTTSQLLFSKSMNDDQEIYPQEFVDALNGFPNESSRSIEVELPKSSSSSNSSISNNFMNIDQYPTALYGSGVAMSPDSVIIKDEPQTVPSMNSSPPLSPINMESQERIKLERKRLRNRVAASKCRRRKLERIAKLEEKVKLLKSENGELNQNVIRLKEEVCLLKQKVIRHVSNGCKIVLSSNFQL